jgi:hypothetical protein
MTLPNHTIFQDLLQMPVGDVVALPAEQLALLQQDIEDNLRRAKLAKDWLDGALALKYGERAAALRREAGKDTGTIRLADGDVTVIADLPKKIEWDQAQLTMLVERIRAGGEDPAEYVSTELKVSERAFTAWPESIRQLFAPARTVRTGKPTFRLSLTSEVSR